MTSSKLQRELKKKQPFASAAQEMVLNLLRTNDQIHIRFTRLFREHGLTPSQYNILRILRGEGQPLECMEIARRTVTVVPGITGLIDRLERAGLVARQRCTEDRRVIRVALSDKGGDLLGRLDEPMTELHRQVVSHMSEEELRQLTQLLEKARQGCQEGTS